MASLVLAGSGTYPSSSAALSPFVYAHSTNAVTALFVSVFSSGSRINVAATIGYDVAPSGSPITA